MKYVSRLQYLLHDMKKGSIEIPDFVAEHDEVLEKRPLTDYGIEPDPLYFTGLSSNSFTYGRLGGMKIGGHLVSLCHKHYESL